MTATDPNPSTPAEPEGDDEPTPPAQAPDLATGMVDESPAKIAREPLARPGCLLTAIASAVGAIVGAVVTGVILLVALSGDDGNGTSESVTASPSAVSATSAPIGTSPSTAVEVAASGVEQAELGDQATGGDAEIADAGSPDAQSRPILDGTISDELLRSELARLLAAADEAPLTADDVVGTPPVLTEADFAYWDRLLRGESGEPGAPLGNRLQQINVKAVLEAVQEAVVIVRVTTADGEGGGSGFVVTPQGRIVTNAHVVADAETIEVRFFGGAQMTAEVIAVDPTRDLAVLQVEADGLPTVKLGSSDGVEVGDEVIAIGNAIGIIGEPTVTRGIVSGLERSIELEDDTRLVRLIQTDAAINLGNSGGPLVNAAGEVIGVNTAIAGGRVEGIGFAISIDHARPIIDLLLEGVVKAKAYLGVRIISVEDFLADNSDDPVTDDPLEGLGDSGPETVEPGPDPADELADIEVPAGITQGALVVGVDEGEAADLAGIERGEIIVEFNGTEITSSLDLVNEILALVPGDSAEMAVVGTDGSRRTIEVELGSFDTEAS
ncbi:S1C family serine protease [Candidatus Poriferisodalis sp.]|uniref:S1C family serine protease n=1 Tax=Candidatus Poriferisodalis sp. TaxID=3101277 RepID=UPI003B52E04A